LGRPLDPAERGVALAEAALAGDRRALARLLTEVENRTAAAEAALRLLYPRAGQAHLVGITGPPGAGKSTLVAALIGELRRAGRSVAVIAVDPSSPITGGALLGDRVRMQAYAEDPDVFIRSMAARGHAGGLAATSGAAAAVLDAVGFDVVFLETVGTGQSEVEVAAAADTTVVLEAPEMGDEIQAIKAGLLEVADIVVVNKGDRPGAQRTAAQLRAMLSAAAVAAESAAERAHHRQVRLERAQHQRVRQRVRPDRAQHEGADDQRAQSRSATVDAGTGERGPTDLDDAGRPRPKRPEVLVTTAATGEGVPELLAAIDRRRRLGAEDGAVAAARRARADALLWTVVVERARDRLARPEAAAVADAIVDAVAEHRLDPYAAADELLALLAGGARAADPTC
jgi:LAO/AO transport system kinase